tara:strand:- start:11824 stop:12162 length:339 start_codon:yes stop_codon:yes gene_type:complete
MSKKEKKEKEELVEDYLTTDELNDIKQVIQDLNSAKIKLADNILEQEQVKKVLDIIKTKLVEKERVLITKYGKDASISLETGKITPKQKETYKAVTTPEEVKQKREQQFKTK